MRVLERAEVLRVASKREILRRNPKKRFTGILKKGFRKQGFEENEIQFPVIIARGIHLFPYRTQKLSL